MKSCLIRLPLAAPLALLGALLCMLALPGSPARAQEKWTGTWPQTGAGDWAEYTTRDGPGLRFEVTAVQDGAVSYRHIVKPAGKDPIVRVIEKKPAAEIRLVFEPGENVTWRDEEVTIHGVKLACRVASWTAGSGGQTTQAEVWYSKQVPCGGLVRQISDGEITMQLVGCQGANLGVPVVLLGSPQPKPEPGPEPQPQADAPAQDYGDPVSLNVPASIRKQMEDQAVAITRLRVYFDTGDATKDGAALEFEEMRTEVPVIFAAFLGERCDRVLNYTDFSARQGHFVDLAFQIKSLPAKLANMKVQVEHSHLQGEAETVLNNFEVPIPGEGEPWNDLRLRGARPGVNRYRLVITYTNSAGETTTYKGFSHWVFVQAPPMFEFVHSASATATARKAGSSTLISADVKLEAGFLLHAGLRPQDVSLRVVRRGKRDLNLTRLSPEVRRVLEKERAPLGWHEVGRGPLDHAVIAGLEKCVVEDSFVRLVFRHQLSASTTTLPMVEQWEYRFELMHKDMPEPLATWQASVNLKVSSESDISSARLRVEGTALAQSLAVAIQKK